MMGNFNEGLLEFMLHGSVGTSDKEGWKALLDMSSNVLSHSLTCCWVRRSV